MSAALRDPILPWLDRLTDRQELGSLLRDLWWLREPRPASAAVRLRWKPGANMRIGVVLDTATGPAAVLAAGFAARSRAKSDRLAALATQGVPVHRDHDVVVVPAAADPALSGLVPDVSPLTYNPARRWVGRVDGVVLKVHAAAPPVGVGRLLTDPGRRLGAHLPGAEVRTGGRVVRTRWVPGRPPTPVDSPAIREALRALHAASPPAGLPVLDAPTILSAVQRAGDAVVHALPGERARIATLSGALRRAIHAGRWPAPHGLVHGDLSPDQVVVAADGRANLLDLDRAALGPAGWDGATWTMAQLATGRRPLPAPTATEPVLLLAAALLRAPEPFRRLRPAWPALTRSVLDAAARAVDSLGGST
ncbi:MAG TPA: hypothetical protein VM367_08580 [Pseudonocardia sp.]|nr:hypothetical protein [Pseudonocardia sp.]